VDSGLEPVPWSTEARMSSMSIVVCIGRRSEFGVGDGDGGAGLMAWGIKNLDLILILICEGL
jgi:hypothetical protein